MLANEQPAGAADVSRCVDCGCELSPGLPRGLCSRCALAGALKLGDEEVSGSEFRVSSLSRQFGDYELLEEIAHGGMGVVYKARQKNLDRLVAVKMLLFGGHADAKSIRRFKVEAVAAGALHHPNIVTLFKKNKDAIDALVNRKVDILKIGGNSYLKAKKRDAQIRLLVSQNPPKQGVIFVRETSDIKTVQDLVNRSIVFGDRFSTISTWAFYHLVQAGVTNLKQMEILDSISAFASDPAVRLQHGSLSSHLLTLHAVQTNGYDAGVSSESTFLRSGPPQGMRAILVFPSDPVWWVVGSDFPPSLDVDLKRALVGLRDPQIFRGISKRITHYLPAKEEELSRLRQAMTVAARYFGGQEDEEE